MLISERKYLSYWWVLEKSCLVRENLFLEGSMVVLFLPFSALCHLPKDLSGCSVLVFCRISKSMKVREYLIRRKLHAHIFYGKSMHWPWPGRLWKISQERAESIHFLSNTTLQKNVLSYAQDILTNISDFRFYTRLLK